MSEFFCTDLLCFPSYLSLQIYCAFPSTFLYRFTVLSQLPFYTYLECFPSYLYVQIYCVSPANFLCRFTVLSHLSFCTDLLFLPTYLSVQIYCAFPSTFLYRFTVLSHLPFCTDLLYFPSYLSVVCHSSKYAPYLFLSLQEFLLCLIKESPFSVNVILLHLYCIGWPRTRGTTAADGAAATPTTTST